MSQPMVGNFWEILWFDRSQDLRNCRKPVFIVRKHSPGNLPLFKLKILQLLLAHKFELKICTCSDI